MVWLIKSAITVTKNLVQNWFLQCIHPYSKFYQVPVNNINATLLNFWINCNWQCFVESCWGSCSHQHSHLYLLNKNCCCKKHNLNSNEVPCIQKGAGLWSTSICCVKDLYPDFQFPWWLWRVWDFEAPGLEFNFVVKFWLKASHCWSIYYPSNVQLSAV